MARSKKTARRKTVAVLTFALLAGLAWLAWTWWTLPSPAPLAHLNPASTALMERRAQEARKSGKRPRHVQKWVPLASISPRLVEAVLASEDARFYQHAGVDLTELTNALRTAWHRRTLGRGASTLTQQLAKNLWLSQDRSLARKAKELIQALRLERALTKPRILTLYLNVAEWGDGVYGAQAAAETYFGASAAELTWAQSAVLASMLPAPRRRTPGSHSPALLRRALWIVDELELAQAVTSFEGAAARTEIAQLLGESNGVPEEEEPGEDAD